MKHKINIFLFVAILAMLSILVMQFFWLKQYYKLSKINFERDINLALEDAMQKELSIRNDTIALQITNNLLDEKEYGIRSKFDTIENKYSYTIINKRLNRNLLSFSSFELNKPLLIGDSIFKRKVATAYAKRIREEDLDNHFVMYRLQNLGAFIGNKVKEIAFDT